MIALRQIESEGAPLVVDGAQRSSTVEREAGVAPLVKLIEGAVDRLYRRLKVVPDLFITTPALLTRFVTATGHGAAISQAQVRGECFDVRGAFVAFRDGALVVADPECAPNTWRVCVVEDSRSVPILDIVAV